MNIQFPPDIEQALRRRAKASGQDLETLVAKIVVDEVSDEVRPRLGHRVSPEEFASRTAGWIKLHPVLDHAIDDSRESIYAGCGE